jgi:hypothetical protein
MKTADDLSEACKAKAAHLAVKMSTVHFTSFPYGLLVYGNEDTIW